MDIISKTFDLLKGIYDNSKSRKKELFQIFVEPALKNIEEVHVNYVNSFEEYFHLIETSKEPFTKDHSVFKKIINDSYFSEALRQKVFSFYDNTNKEMFDPFVKAIGRYCFLIIESSQYDDFYLKYMDLIKYKYSDMQVWMLSYLNSQRARVYTRLFVESNWDLSNQQKITLAKEGIIEILRDLQISYRHILDQYHHLKALCYSS